MSENKMTKNGDNQSIQSKSEQENDESQINLTDVQSLQSGSTNSLQTIGTTSTLSTNTTSKSEKQKNEVQSQLNNQSFTYDSNQDDEGTQTKKFLKQNEKIKKQMIQTRRATNQTDFQNRINSLISEEKYDLLIYFLIESEIYNNQADLFVMLRVLFERKGIEIFNNVFCQREILKYLQKCPDLGKTADILYLTFQNPSKYDQEFFQKMLKIIQKQIKNPDLLPDLFLTNYFRIMIQSKRFNRTEGKYIFPEKSKTKPIDLIRKILIIIQYVIAFPKVSAVEWINFSSVEIVKIIVDYIFILNTEDILQVHYIKFLFELIQPTLEAMAQNEKNQILQYTLECLMITYDEEDSFVKSPSSSAILLSYFETCFLNEQFNIDEVINVFELTAYELKNLIKNMLIACPTNFVFLVIQQIAENLRLSNQPTIKHCLKEDIFKGIILKSMLFYVKKDGDLQYLCQLISAFLYIYNGGDQEDSQKVLSILKYNNFIFNPYSEVDKVYRQKRINDYCKVIGQIIFHAKVDPETLNKFKKAYISVKSTITAPLTFQEFQENLSWYYVEDPNQDIYIDKSIFQGIFNYANNCYFSSFMQILLRLDLFQTYILQEQKNIKTSMFDMIRQIMGYLINEKKQNDNFDLQSSIKGIINLASPQFKWGTQNDPCEFMQQYIMKLFYDQNHIFDQREKDKADVILDLFNIERFQRKSCLACNSVSDYKLERLNLIQLYLNNTVSDSIDFIKLAKQVTQNDKIEYYCENCKKSVQMDQDILYSKIPPLLVFQLTRVNSMQKKNISYVNFPEQFNFLEIQNCGISFPYSKSNYKLVGVVNHIGSSTFAGHYISFLRYYQSNHWIKFDDNNLKYYEELQTIHQIMKEQQEIDKTNTPYILFYQNLESTQPVQIDEQIKAYLDRFQEYQNIQS